MLFVSKEGEIINTEPGNIYFEKCISLINKWEKLEREFVVQTSGSTGTPKNISINQKMIEASINQTIEAFDLNENDLIFSCLNVDFIAGKLMILRALYLKCDLIIVEPSANPFKNLGKNLYFLETSRNKIFMAFVPMQIQNIIDSGEDYISLLNLAKSIIIGGAACSEALIEALDQVHSPLFATYGMTETVTHIALQRLNGVEKSEYFKVLNGVEIKQLPNETIAIKSKSTDNIWVETNDIVEILSDTEFKLIGRIDNTINSGGVKIQLEILEAKIQKILTKNLRFFLFGLDDPRLGKKLCMVLETSDVAFLEHLKKELREKLPKFEIPKEYFLIDKFIETPTSKIDKKKTINELS